MRKQLILNGTRHNNAGHTVDPVLECDGLGDDADARPRPAALTTGGLRHDQDGDGAAVGGDEGTSGSVAVTASAAVTTDLRFFPESDDRVRPPPPADDR
eukprot:5976461-Pyramimonas_sp.AAC.1